MIKKKIFIDPVGKYFFKVTIENNRATFINCYFDFGRFSSVRRNAIVYVKSVYRQQEYV